MYSLLTTMFKHIGLEFGVELASDSPLWATSPLHPQNTLQPGIIALKVVTLQRSVVLLLLGASWDSESGFQYKHPPQGNTEWFFFFCRVANKKDLPKVLGTWISLWFVLGWGARGCCLSGERGSDSHSGQTSYPCLTFCSWKGGAPAGALRMFGEKSQFSGSQTL